MNFNPLVIALAVLGSTQLSVLNRLTDSNLDQTEATLLFAGIAVIEPGGWLTMAQDEATAYLNALETEDFFHFRHLHEQAIRILAEQLMAGKLSHETAFATVFIRLAERLLNQAPQELADLVETVREIPVSPATRDYIILFEGIALRNLERYTDAVTHLDELLARADVALDVRGRALNARGISLFWQGQLQPALDSYAASITIWRQLGNSVQEAMARLNVGIVLYELHDYGQAEAQLQRAEQLFRAAQSSMWMPTVWNELGLVYRDQGLWEEASTYFERALAQRRAEGSEHLAGIILNNIGEILLLQGRLDDAELAFAQALAKMTVHNVRVDTFINLGLLQQMRGDLVGAEQQYVRALQLAQEIDRRDIWPTVHYRLAEVLQHTQTAVAALAHLEQGIELVETSRMPLRDEGLRISLLGRAQQLYELAVLLLMHEGRRAEAFAMVERARARSFLDLLSTVYTVGPSHVEKERRDAPADAMPLTATEIQAQMPAEAVLVEFFASGSPGTYAALLANLPLEAQKLRKHLLPSERLFAFVISRAELHIVELQASLSQIEAQHFNRGDGRLRGITPSPERPLRPFTRWRDLGMVLLRPLQPLLAGKRQLTFVPYGPLHYLPLHALIPPTELTGVHDATVSYAPSASILIKHTRFGARLPRTPTLLAVGFNGDSLEHAEAEAAWIAKQFNGDALLGDAARPGTVLQALASYDVVHFSCHGHFRRRNPMDSALTLAHGELTAASLLHAAQMHGTQLQADIVTLSACDTGLNHVAASDELIGLTRAFLGCGARSLLVTLWPVHELPTRLFMEQFYQAWWNGSSKAAALAAAQRFLIALDADALRERLSNYGMSAEAAETSVRMFGRMLPGNYPFAHPFYWAPFLLIGDAG